MITAVILVKDEEENIDRCLNSVSFCEEVIVIDDESSDTSPAIAKKRGAKVVTHKLNRNFSDQRNYALNLAKTEWILFVDADEEVDKQLADEILQTVQTSTKNGYFIKRRDFLFGKELKHGELAGKKFLRLGRRNKGEWTGAVHETWNIRGSVGTLRNPLIHKPHQSISDFIEEINFYTTLRAKELYSAGVRSSWYSIVLYTKGKFFYTYFVKGGFLDGVPGLIMTLMMSLHSFLVRSKLYFLAKK